VLMLVATSVTCVGRWLFCRHVWDMSRTCLDDVEYVTMQWVDRYNNSALGVRLPAACALRRLLPPLDPQKSAVTHFRWSPPVCSRWMPCETFANAQVVRHRA